MAEVWRDIVGYEGHYMVSSRGRVKSLRRVFLQVTRTRGDGEDVLVRSSLKERILKPVGRDYLVVSLSKGNKAVQRRINRLVAEAFLPNPENKPEVNHKDGDKHNNNKNNLEWATTLENHRHAAKTGLKAAGSRNGSAKLTETDIPIIRKRLAAGEPMHIIAKDFGVTVCPIYGIKHVTRWKHVP